MRRAACLAIAILALVGGGAAQATEVRVLRIEGSINPAATASWFPRTKFSVTWRIDWRTSSGRGPYPTTSPRHTSTSASRNSISRRMACHAWRFPWISEKMA